MEMNTSLPLGILLILGSHQFECFALFEMLMLRRTRISHLSGSREVNRRLGGSQVAPESRPLFPFSIGRQLNTRKWVEVEGVAWFMDGWRWRESLKVREMHLLPLFMFQVV